MQKIIETVIGNGNRFHDVSFLWCRNPESGLRSESEQTLRETANILGLTQEKTISQSATEAELRSAFTDALLARPPRPMAADAVRFLVELSKALPGFAARRQFVTEFTRWISEGRVGALTEWQSREELAFKSFDPEALRRHLVCAFTQPTVIVERSPPTAESVLALLSKGSAVAIGAYVGFRAAGDTAPLFLYASVPGGMLLCCTAAGIAEALQLGLRERIYAWLSGSKVAAQAVQDGAAALRDLLGHAEPNRSQGQAGGEDGHIRGAPRR